MLVNFDDNFNLFNSKLKLSKDKYLSSISQNISNISIEENNLQDLNSISSESLSNSSLFLNKFIAKIKSLNKIFDKLHFNLSNESINFKFNIYKNLSDILLMNNMNLSNEELKYFKFYLHNKPFKVINCDKNVGLCIIKNDIYNDFVFSQLNDCNNYIRILSDPLESTISTIKIKLDKLLLNKDIHISLHKGLVPNNKKSKLGSFRLLAKLHKEKLGFRPIINCISHPTSCLSLLVDCILQPFVKSSVSYLQDSQNLIQKTKEMYFPLDSKLYSCDFEGLYTNIDLNHAFYVISDFMMRNFDSRYLSIIGFREILRLVFDNNIFSFDKKFFRQIRGIAMGSKCGPSVANIYIAQLEKKFLTIHKPLLYYRFIDDIFTIVNSSFDINLLVNNFDYLKLNIVTSYQIVFLDLTIELCKITGHLNYTLYTKPTCTFSYLLSSSNHPKFIFDNIPKSIFIRIRRICTSFSDYLFFGGRLLDQLHCRGYDKRKIFNEFIRVSKIDRNLLIPYKVKKVIKTNDNNIFFKLPFDINLNTNSLNLAFNTASNELRSNSAFENSKIRLVHNIQNNFASTLVHNKSLYSNIKYRYIKCKSHKCIICKHANESYCIRLNEFLLPILSHSTCSSKFVIYILKCNFCSSYYIGQTEDLYRRLRTHIRCCKLKIVPNSSICSKIINHFHLNDNCTFDNFSFFVFRNDVTNKYQRLNIETQLIHLFIDLGLKVLNDFIPDRFYWYTNVKLFEIKV